MTRPRVASSPDGATVVLATRNQGKIAEIRRLLANRRCRLLDLDEVGFRGELAEPGATYEENARAKADAVRDATGVAALADDSGIEVLGLAGWPGPLSARWLTGSDADRLRGLLVEVDRRSPGDRRVRYVAVAALALPFAAPAVSRGECRGVLVTPRGARGFGYDPAFCSDDLGRTFAEATAAEKDSCSHRARALVRLAATGLLGAPEV